MHSSASRTPFQFPFNKKLQLKKSYPRKACSNTTEGDMHPRTHLQLEWPILDTEHFFSLFVHLTSWFAFFLEHQSTWACRKRRKLHIICSKCIKRDRSGLRKSQVLVIKSHGNKLTHISKESHLHKGKDENASKPWSTTAVTSPHHYLSLLSSSWHQPAFIIGR